MATFQHYAAITLTRLEVPRIEEILRKITGQLLKTELILKTRPNLSLLYILY